MIQSEDGSTTHIIGSGILLATHRDYSVAVACSSGSVRFHISDLGQTDEWETVVTLELGQSNWTVTSSSLQVTESEGEEGTCNVTVSFPPSIPARFIRLGISIP